MSLRTRTDDERAVVFACLRAAVDGPFFPEWEFETLFGLPRAEVAALVAALPDIDDTPEPEVRRIWERWRHEEHDTPA